MPWTLALDLLMTVLLAATIVATVLLNRRLTALRDARSEMEMLADRFSASTSRADEGVAGLKVKAQSLQQQVEAARGLAADLEFLIERGGGIADRLEANVRATRRSEARPTVGAGIGSGASTAGGIATGQATGYTTAGMAATTAGTAAGAVAAGGGKARSREPAEPRSAAERHLLAALRTQV